LYSSGVPPANIETPRFEALIGARHCIDFPRSGDALYDTGVSIAGWLHVADRDPSRCRIRAWCGGNLIGETRAMFARTDVSTALGIAASAPTGFRLLARIPDQPRASEAFAIRLSVSWEAEGVEYKFGKVTVRLVPANLRDRHYGEVVFPEQSTVLHRENVYGSGPPIPHPGAEMLKLVTDYLSPRSSVVDVGCGAGAYGPPLIARGHEWLGIEVSDHCSEILQRRALPFRKAEPGAQRLPVADKEFDHAICIEVLEHTVDPFAFARELARVTRRRALLTVPNMEVIPFFRDWDVVPWHMLEADHKNFFTRANLREVLATAFRNVEIFSFGEHPLRTRAGVPLHIHLFAVADV
jgi:2-polyprenyl-3-methyl-5-hydroxy-6-metoxy-1,4-benzoquinol methylase